MKSKPIEPAWLKIMKQKLIVPRGMLEFVTLRPKTSSAMGRVFASVPIQILNKLPTVIVLAPRGVYGLTFRVPSFLVADGAMIIYLNETLEKRPQRRVDSVVAHELAHVVLRHPRYAVIPKTFRELDHREQRVENEADKMIESWGFVAANSGRKAPPRRPKTIQKRQPSRWHASGSRR